MKEKYVILVNKTNHDMKELSNKFQGTGMDIYDYDDLEELLFTIKDFKFLNINIIALI